MKTLNRILVWGKKCIPLIGILILFYIIVTLDVKTLYEIVMTSHIPYILLCVFFPPVIILVMAVRWHLILRALGIRSAFINTWNHLIKGILLGEITPGRLGDLFRAKFLTAETCASPGKAVFSVVIDRIYDLVVLVILTSINSLVLIKFYEIEIPLAVIFLLTIGCLAFFALILNKNMVKSLLSPVFNHLISRKHQENLSLHFNEFYEGLKSMRQSTYIACVMLSLVIWQLKFLGLYLLSQALRIPVPFWFTFSIGAITTAIGLLPISISGFGTREAAFIVFLSFYHLPAEFAVALSFLYRVFGIWGILISSGLVYGYQLVRALRP